MTGDLCLACADADVSPLDDTPEWLRGLARILDDHCVGCVKEYAHDWGFEVFVADAEETDTAAIYASLLLRTQPELI